MVSSDVVEASLLLRALASGQGQGASVLVLAGILESLRTVWLPVMIGWRTLLEGRAAGDRTAHRACARLEVQHMISVDIFNTILLNYLGLVPCGWLHWERLAKLLALKRPKLALQSLRGERRLLSCR